MGKPRFRSLPLDGKLLRFDRDTGVNQLWSGDETAHLVQKAPRVLQVAITNICNKSCEFCYRPLDADSAWTFEELIELAHFCGAWGVLEFAFGGGEPTVFPRFTELMKRIWNETTMCPNFTTNGIKLSEKMLAELAGHYGQIQLSIYDDDDYWSAIDRLVAAEATFGLNYLVTPERVRTLEPDLYRFAERGVRDVLLLSYKGDDSSMHLGPRDLRRFDDSVSRLHEHFGEELALKVDVCWGSRLEKTPQLLYDGGDCGAGRGFMSIGSDKTVLACSFQQSGIRFDDVRELPAIYMKGKYDNAPAGPGCARLPECGIGIDASLVVLGRRVESLETA